MIKAVIIDDEPLARLIIKEYLKTFTEIEIVDECNNGFEGVKSIARYKPDLIFLDIQMPKINGFEMLELIEDPPSVIFTSAFDEYALKAFEANAIDYLLKPFSKERFDKALQKHIEKYLSTQTKSQPELAAFIEKSPEEANRIVVRINNDIRIIPVSDIQYLEAYDDYVKIHTKDTCYLKKKTLQFYETALSSKQFIRSHRSYLVKISEITRIEPLEKDNHIVLLKSGARIPVSRTGYAKIKSVLGI